MEWHQSWAVWGELNNSAAPCSSSVLRIINTLQAPLLAASALLDREILKGMPMVTHRGSNCDLNEKDKGQREYMKWRNWNNRGAHTSSSELVNYLASLSLQVCSLAPCPAAISCNGYNYLCSGSLKGLRCGMCHQDEEVLAQSATAVKVWVKSVTRQH